MHYDCAIIGGGPGGLTAGLYACRGGLKTVLLEQTFTGGQIVNTHRMDNFPGFPAGISGVDFGMALTEQAVNQGLEIRYEGVTSVALQASPKVIHCGKETLTADAVILAMGATPRPLGLPNEEKLRGSGVSYCATCDGAFMRGKTVAVVGGGDTALTDALYLSEMAEQVYLIHRRDTFRSTLPVDRKNIQPVMSSQVTALIGEDKLEGIEVE